MKTTGLGQRFFESTRGRIVSLLRDAPNSTVEDLAGELELTDNAVRAHLTTLERDGLVQQKGQRRGVRKPHNVYALTPEAERLFPKAYDALLNQLLAALKNRLAPQTMAAALREAGRALASGYVVRKEGESLESRVRRALKALESLGGLARVEKHDDKLLIRSESCPLAAAVAEHPEVCKLVEALVAEIVEVPVRERCNRAESPRCTFEIAKTN